MWSGRDSKAFFTNEKKLINLLVGNGESNLQRKREREGGERRREGRERKRYRKEREKEGDRVCACFCINSLPHIIGDSLSTFNFSGSPYTS